jgi:hypothetical protein
MPESGSRASWILRDVSFNHDFYRRELVDSLELRSADRTIHTCSIHLAGTYIMPLSLNSTAWRFSFLANLLGEGL